jgi:S-adenosyl-L-methionine hydrolase (adenosine-forming)
MKTPIVTLLTDFGTQDPFVGVMKGVMLSICPRARLVDLSHEVPPQSVAGGAFLLKSSIDYFPKGTVHLAVVDPGVGSARRAIVLKSRGCFFVGPDNGLLPAALEAWGIQGAVELTEKRYRLPDPSTTFHGRDVFAPAAAHLAAGVSFSKLGGATNHWIWREIPKPYQGPAGWSGEVLWVDHFGNLVTNLEKRHLPKPFRLRVGKAVILNLVTHYAAIRRGTVAALVGSSGHLEVSVNGGSAAQKLGVGVGAPVTLR